MFKFAAGRREQLLADPHVIFHRTADVETQQDFHRIVPLRHHTQIEKTGVAGGLVDRIVEVELVGRPLAGKFSEAPERNLDVAGTELNRIVEIPVLAFIPDFDGAAMARAPLADAHAFGIVTMGAKR